MTDRPFSFAVALGADASPAELREIARAAEDLGYSYLFCSDHLHQRLSPLAAATVALECTSRLRVSTYVLNCGLRYPMVLAHELHAVHQVSEGRLMVGLGAGWLRSDYEAAQLPFAAGAARVDRLITVFATVREYFDGHVADVAPAARRPSFLIGGGQRRILRFAARNADVVSLTAAATPEGSLSEDDLTASACDAKYQWVREAAGARWPEIELNHVTWECWVTPRPAGVLAALSSAMKMPESEVRELPCMLIGTPGDVEQTLLGRRERWDLSLVSVPAQALRSFAPVVARLAGR